MDNTDADEEQSGRSLLSLDPPAEIPGTTASEADNSITVSMNLLIQPCITTP